jgi:hypothetical protein
MVELVSELLLIAPGSLQIEHESLDLALLRLENPSLGELPRLLASTAQK